MAKAEVVRVIRTHDRRGGGRHENEPVRLVEQYWSLDGTLLWEKDDFEVEDKRKPIVCDEHIDNNFRQGYGGYSFINWLNKYLGLTK